MSIDAKMARLLNILIEQPPDVHRSAVSLGVQIGTTTQQVNKLIESSPELAELALSGKVSVGRHGFKPGWYRKAEDTSKVVIESHDDELARTNPPADTTALTNGARVNVEVSQDKTLLLRRNLSKMDKARIAKLAEQYQDASALVSAYETKLTAAENDVRLERAKTDEWQTRAFVAQGKLITVLEDKSTGTDRDQQS